MTRRNALFSALAMQSVLLARWKGRQDDSCTGPVVETKATIEGGVLYTSRSTAVVPQGSKTGRVKRARAGQQHKNAGILNAGNEPGAGALGSQPPVGLDESAKQRPSVTSADLQPRPKRRSFSNIRGNNHISNQKSQMMGVHCSLALPEALVPCAARAPSSSCLVTRPLHSSNGPIHGYRPRQEIILQHSLAVPAFQARLFPMSKPLSFVVPTQ